MTVEEVFHSFKSLRVLILGDVMLDAYLWGEVNRISPEAPVPIVNILKREKRLGGAANVALNIKALGAEPIICSVLGQDHYGEEFKGLMESAGMTSAHMLMDTERKTTCKSRIISQKQQMLRVDEESVLPLSKEMEGRFLTHLKKLLAEERIDVVIFEDYNKGVLTEKVIQETIALLNEHNIPSAVDPKKEHFFAYQDVTLFKPNFKELKEGLNAEITPGDIDSVRQAVTALQEKLNNTHTLVTLSEHGVLLQNSSDVWHYPAHVREISDVSGAGDTVISVAALCLALQTDLQLLTRLSNLAGGIVCEHVGVVPISREHLFKEAQEILG